MTDDLVVWAEEVARTCLRDLPRRLQHVEGVARRAATVADAVDDPELLVAAAWLHDIGYSAELVTTGFHSVDGAEFLHAEGAPHRLCALVANHSCACVEARRRGYRGGPRTPARRMRQGGAAWRRWVAPELASLGWSVDPSGRTD
ncbi:HD domain-containing protein [Nocardia sp. NPDC058519]|uniref:HD domain-containing protein n=1 Tax=Nocardia sp. NPDC058519 TaxID=3346535 RepID=UPI003650BC03